MTESDHGTPTATLMDLPSAGSATLLERMRTALANIAAAGPLGRSEARRHAAETLLALGMPQEAPLP